ncbi:MAG TPA: hypothetical protein DCE44_18420 [Verrucomicrobiales bacterium]|nr:hypothetical protein [Verrucomicrobiales bacterium]
MFASLTPVRLKSSPWNGSDQSTDLKISGVKGEKTGELDSLEWSAFGEGGRGGRGTFREDSRFMRPR